MAANKSGPTDLEFDHFLQGILPEKRAVEARRLDEVFRKASGFEPVIWGSSIVGYGGYRYRYASGREGESLATGFAPRKAKLSIYIMPGYQDYSGILARLGKHSLGKSCLYINKLSDVDLSVLQELITVGLRDLNSIWPVKARLR